MRRPDRLFLAITTFAVVGFYLLFAWHLATFQDNWARRLFLS